MRGQHKDKIVEMEGEIQQLKSQLRESGIDPDQTAGNVYDSEEEGTGRREPRTSETGGALSGSHHLTPDTTHFTSATPGSNVRYPNVAEFHGTHNRD